MALIYERNTGKAIVRVYSGSLSREEWQQKVREAGAEFYKAIRPELERQGRLHEFARPVLANEER